MVKGYSIYKVIVLVEQLKDKHQPAFLSANVYFRTDAGGKTKITFHTRHPSLSLVCFMLKVHKEHSNKCKKIYFKKKISNTIIMEHAHTTQQLGLLPEISVLRKLFFWTSVFDTILKENEYFP